jgi:hypothetical protein
MLEQYHVVNKCLLELQKSNLPTTVKLKLEVQLYHLKRVLLLEEVAAVVKSDADNKREFMEMYDAFRHVCTIEPSEIEVKKLIMRQIEMKQALYAHSRRENAAAGRGHG